MPRLRIATLFAALLLPLLLFAGQAHAQTIPPAKTIDYFNFNNASLANNASGPGTVGVYNFGSYTFGTGTTTGATSGTSAGYGLTGTDSPSAPNDGIFELKTKTTGYNNLTLSFASEKSSNGYANLQLEYSTDDTNFYYAGAAQIVTTDFQQLQTFNISSLTNNALNNQKTVYLDIVFYNPKDSSSNYNGSASIDNLLLTGNIITPAPAGLVSMGIGLGMAGLGALARRRRVARTA